MSEKSNPAAEELDRKIGEKFGHMIQHRAMDNLWSGFVANSRRHEFGGDLDYQFHEDDTDPKESQ
ncbi:hypothetical protein QE394_001119 [Arthrobacter sp. SORGH_AS 212]|uniref:hypothetical protein n=1 Tax=Pseudarthrobacter sp. SORGH_AS 212 TaxID=3041777 RepID=UPI00278209CF|nr:hypothetical protein [Arthrobacter sp. SORGH_AS_0212]